MPLRQGARSRTIRLQSKECSCFGTTLLSKDTRITPSLTTKGVPTRKVGRRGRGSRAVFVSFTLGLNYFSFKIKYKWI